MNNLRNKTRIETQYMVSARLGSEGHTDKEIRAMILNISMDGAMIETAEPVQHRSLVLANMYKNQIVSIHAKIIHHQDVPHEERVFGPYRTGLHFLNNTVGAREFIISIIKSQEVEQTKSLPKHPPKEKPEENGDIPSEWMNTEQISMALFSTDSFDEDLEMSSALEDATEIMAEAEQEEEPTFPDLEMAPEPPEPMVNPNVEPEPSTPSSFKESVEQTLFKPVENDKPARAPIRKAPIIMTFLAFIILGGSLFIFRSPGHDGAASLMDRLGIDIPFFGERSILTRPETPEPVSGDTEPPARLLKDTIESIMIKNDLLGQLFVIRGYIKLEEGRRPEEVNVRGKLLDAQKKIVASMTVWPGNRIDNESIAGFNHDDLVKVRDYTPETGYRSRTPFIMIFSEIPDDSHSFVVDLTFNKL